MPAVFSGAARDCSVAEGSPIFHSISSPVKAYKAAIVVPFLPIEHSPEMFLENVDFLLSNLVKHLIQHRKYLTSSVKRQGISFLYSQRKLGVQSVMGPEGITQILRFQFGFLKTNCGK